MSGALALVAIMVRARGAGAQFLVATHSPVLLACPGARIYELDDGGLAERGYDDVEAVRLTRAFLDAPDRFLRAALEELVRTEDQLVEDRADRLGLVDVLRCATSNRS